MLLLLFLLYCRVGITYVAGSNQDTKIIFYLKNGLKSPISSAFERQVSEKISEYFFF